MSQIAKVDGLDSRTVQNLLDNPDYRQFRAGYLSAVLKSIRAWQKPNEE
jgi:hypothetical protein